MSEGNKMNEGKDDLLGSREEERDGRRREMTLMLWPLHHVNTGRAASNRTHLLRKHLVPVQLVDERALCKSVAKRCSEEMRGRNHYAQSSRLFGSDFSKHIWAILHKFVWKLLVVG